MAKTFPSLKVKDDESGEKIYILTLDIPAKEDRKEDKKEYEDYLDELSNGVTEKIYATILMFKEDYDKWQTLQ